MKYIIAKSNCESLLISKEAWENNPDDWLKAVHEFEAENISDAEKIYDDFLSIKSKR